MTDPDYILAQAPQCRVIRDAAGMLQLTIGPVSIRLTEQSLEMVRATLVEACRHLHEHPAADRPALQLISSR